MEKLYGRHAVLECLRAKRRKSVKLWIAEGVEEAPILREIRELAQTQRVPQALAKRDFVDQVSTHAQGVLLDTSDFPYDSSIDDILAVAQVRGEKPFMLVLDSLQDPQNFGNLIRTAEAVGVHGIVIPERRSAAVTPAVANASAGAVEHMCVARVVNLARAVDELKARDVWTYALQGDARATDLYKTDLRGVLALIVGSEGEGVSRLLRDKADFLVKLPMHGRIESLNASVAGAVALYEALRQRQK